MRTIDIVYKNEKTSEVSELSNYLPIPEFVKGSPHGMTQVRAQINAHKLELLKRKAIVYFGKRVLVNPAYWLQALKDGVFMTH